MRGSCSNLELLATGALSPLTGFMGSADYESVIERMRLVDGTPWPLPLTLAVSSDGLGLVRPGSEVALRDALGRLWGTLSVTELYEGDPRREALAAYGTSDEAHPGVARLLRRPTGLVAGPVRVLPLPVDLPQAALRLTPVELRARIAEKGLQRVAGFQTILAALPADLRSEGPREAVLRALVGKNYGISHLIVGAEQSNLLAAFAPGELGVEPLALDSAVHPAAPKSGGYVVWFTGLSGAGKSTLAQALRPILGAERPVEILDGDEVRTHLSKGLGFSKEDRDTNIRRIGYVARLLGRSGAVAVTAAISPYQETRAEVRAATEKDGVEFVEVFVDAAIAVLADRDVKGLYKKALAGELPHFTGVSDPYERPDRPDVVVHSDQETVEQSLARIIAHLKSRGLLDGKARRSSASRHASPAAGAHSRDVALQQ